MYLANIYVYAVYIYMYIIFSNHNDQPMKIDWSIYHYHGCVAAGIGEDTVSKKRRPLGTGAPILESPIEVTMMYMLMGVMVSLLFC